MVNGTDGAGTCGACGAAVAAAAATCSACGAAVGARVPTGARPTEHPTNVLRRPDAADTTSQVTASGLPTRVPRRDADEDAMREAFTRSWEASSAEPTPITRPPFTPTYLTDPPRPRRPLSELINGSEPPKPAEPPEPAQPPKPAEPPQPVGPPEPRQPPTPPEPRPGPTPFPPPPPTPPAPPPPHPGPVPPGPAPEPIPPVPPAPEPPAPLPTPPPPVPSPPVIVPGRRQGASLYQGGNYGELQTQPITGFVVGPTKAAGVRYAGEHTDPRMEMSGSLTGHILSRGIAQSRRRERRNRLRTVLWITIGLLVFMGAIAAIVDILAGDFIRSLFRTFAGLAG